MAAQRPGATRRTAITYGAWVLTGLAIGLPIELDKTKKPFEPDASPLPPGRLDGRYVVVLGDSFAEGFGAGQYGQPRAYIVSSGGNNVDIDLSVQLLRALTEPVFDLVNDPDFVAAIETLKTQTKEIIEAIHKISPTAPVIWQGYPNVFGDAQDGPLQLSAARERNFQQALGLVNTALAEAVCASGGAVFVDVQSVLNGRDDVVTANNFEMWENYPGLLSQSYPLFHPNEEGNKKIAAALEVALTDLPEVSATSISRRGLLSALGCGP